MVNFQSYPFNGFLVVTCGWTDRRYSDTKNKIFATFRYERAKTTAVISLI
jgi:hypothetical protein